MNDDKHHAEQHCSDYDEHIKNTRRLADYIRTSLWDEMMNQRREYWLWERKGVTPLMNEHYR